ncbi:MAG: VTT domain-containing protein [Candidatus Dormibacteria bacterium]
MSFLQGLHGTVAIFLLVGLLFTEEAGVPLPFAPGELTLIAAGLLVASGGLNPFLFVPLAIAGCVAGAMIGYGWARLVGEHGLVSLARRLHQEPNLERVSKRMRSAGWGGVAVSRWIPGLRIYTTLVAGAVQMPRRTYVTGLVPATVAWVIVFTALGAVVGIPVVHFLSSVQKLAVQGGILLVLGGGGYFAIRRTPKSGGAGLVRIPRAVRIGLAATIDIGVIASIATGLLALGRVVLGASLVDGWLDLAVALLVVLIFYAVVARHGAGATVGESLMQTTYASGLGMPRRPADAWNAARALLSRGDDALDSTAALLRGLGDTTRLHLVSALLDGSATADQLATSTGSSTFEVSHQLDRLLAVGVITATAPGLEAPLVFRLRGDLVSPLLQFLAATAGAAPDVAGGS